MRPRITRDAPCARLDAGTPTILFEALPEKYWRDLPIVRQERAA
ncbi:MAG TPA: hypothetical protein VNZ53_25390 [Steroidobacteraceae bacterium]|nr:hypothetical protein [Steroidobacteraceae bacterium]